jgi:glucokinase
MRATIGVDVGATTISGGLVTPDGDILHARQLPTRGGPATVVGRLLDVIDDLVREARTRGVSVDGVGVGVAGPVDPRTGTMLAHPSNALPELAQLPLADDIRRMVPGPVFIDNDGNALALAEWTWGVGRGARSLALFAIGTHVGGGIILDDALVRGRGGFAGEFHLLPVDFDGPPCPPLGRGCLGEYVCGDAIASEARQQVLTGSGGAHLLERAGGDPAWITSELVFQAATDGDPVAKAIADRACEALAAGIGFVVSALNPEVVVVTGGVARSLAPLQEELRRRAGAYALEPALAQTRLHVVSGDKGQTARGGAALVRYELERARLSGRA